MLIAFFLFRNSILYWAFDKVKEKVKQKYHLSLSAESVSFAGIQKVNFHQIVAVPDSADTLLTISNLSLDVSLLNLLTGSIGFNEVRCDTFNVHDFNKTNRNNISFLKKKKSGADTLIQKNNEESSYR